MGSPTGGEGTLAFGASRPAEGPDSPRPAGRLSGHASIAASTPAAGGRRRSPARCWPESAYRATALAPSGRIVVASRAAAPGLRRRTSRTADIADDGTVRDIDGVSS